MGVRAKMEAVIYAAEEPVTLAQLTALFGEEALAERGAAESVDPDERLAGAAVEAVTAEQLTLEASGDAPEDASGDASSDSAEEAAEQSAADKKPDADAEKRAQRLRDRQQREAVRAELTALMAEYDAGDRGMEIREIAGGYRVATKPEYHDAVRAFAKSLKPPMKLTLQALETLAVIAYKQPVTAPEVSEIRGVDSGGVMGSLISRKLVTTAGRKQVLGRPILYKTTKEFLLRFGLKDLAELPSMEEFEKMAGELQSLGDEAEGQPEQASLPVDGESEEGDTEAEIRQEVPQEPAQSVIVVEDAEPVERGVQVADGGAAVGDGVAAETHVPEAGRGAPGLSRDEQRFEETNDSPNEKEEAEHG